MISDIDIKRAYMLDQALSNQVKSYGVNWQALRLARQAYEKTPYNELTGAQIEGMERRISAACLARMDEIRKERRP